MNKTYCLTNQELIALIKDIAPHFNRWQVMVAVMESCLVYEKLAQKRNLLPGKLAPMRAQHTFTHYYIQGANEIKPKPHKLGSIALSCIFTTLQRVANYSVSQLNAILRTESLRRKFRLSYQYQENLLNFAHALRRSESASAVFKYFQA